HERPGELDSPRPCYFHKGQPPVSVRTWGPILPPVASGGKPNRPLTPSEGLPLVAADLHRSGDRDRVDGAACAPWALAARTLTRIAGSSSVEPKTCRPELAALLVGGLHNFPRVERFRPDEILVIRVRHRIIFQVVGVTTADQDRTLEVVVAELDVIGLVGFQVADFHARV